MFEIGGRSREGRVSLMSTDDSKRQRDVLPEAREPETTLNRLSSDPRYLRNLDFGEMRDGHPEGSVRNHIADLERNLARLADRLSETDRQKPRILIHTHWHLWKQWTRTGKCDRTPA